MLLIKKMALCILSFIIIILMSSCNVFSSTNEKKEEETKTIKDDTFEYMPLEDNTLKLQAIIKSDSDKLINLSIPNEYDGKKVTVIASNTFEKCSNIKQLTIPSNIKIINSMAFFSL